MDFNLHTVNIYNQYVKEYTDKFMDLNLYKDTFDHLLKTLPHGANILELGCGPGNVVKYLKTERADLRVLGIDLAPGMIEVAKSINPDAGFLVLDINDLSKIEGCYDAIIAAFCIPYLSTDSLVRMFTNVKRLINRTKGIFYISCMEGPREKSGFESTSFTGDSEMYINYYPRTEIESLITDFGFKIIKFYTKDYYETDGSITTDLIYIAENGTID